MTLVLQCDFALVEAPNLNLVQDPLLLDAFPGVVESRCRPGGLLPFVESLEEIISFKRFLPCLNIFGSNACPVRFGHLCLWVVGRLDEEFLRMGGLVGRSLGCVGVESLGAVFEKLV